MRSSYRLKEKHEFSNAIKEGKRMVGSNFLFFFQNNNLSNCQFGISIPRRLVRKANRRNYYKRQIKHILTIFLQNNLNRCPDTRHFNLLIIIRPGFLKNIGFVNKKENLLSMLIELNKK
jgi:ribonuclease P protein component